jgi:hypothetical protein
LDCIGLYYYFVNIQYLTFYHNATQFAHNNVQPALIQLIVCLALEFRLQTTQGCRIYTAAVLFMAIMMRYHFIKIANHVLLIVA